MEDSFVLFRGYIHLVLSQFIAVQLAFTETSTWFLLLQILWKSFIVTVNYCILTRKLLENLIAERKLLEDVFPEAESYAGLTLALNRSSKI